MSDDEQYNQVFEQSGAGASATYPMKSSQLRKNGHAVISGRPSKIVEMNNGTGEDGQPTIEFIGFDIFTGKKLSAIISSNGTMDVPRVTRDEYQLVNIDEGFLNLMTQDGTPKDDVKLPYENLGKQIQCDFEDGKDLLITVISSMGEEAAISVKEAPKSS